MPEQAIQMKLAVLERMKAFCNRNSASFQSRSNPKGSSGRLHLEPGNHCIIWDSSASEGNNTRTFNDHRHLQVAIHPLPVHDIPKTVLQFECSSGAESDSFPNLSTRLGLSNSFLKWHCLLQMTIICIHSTCHPQQNLHFVPQRCLPMDPQMTLPVEPKR